MGLSFRSTKGWRKWLRLVLLLPVVLLAAPEVLDCVCVQKAQPSDNDCCPTAVAARAPASVSCCQAVASRDRDWSAKSSKIENHGLPRLEGGPAGYLAFSLRADLSPPASRLPEYPLLPRFSPLLQSCVLLI